MALDNRIDFNIDNNQPTPVFDDIASKILNGILNQLKLDSSGQSEFERQSLQNQGTSIKSQISSNTILRRDSKARESSDRAIQKAIYGINYNQSRGLSNNKAIQKAIYGISSNQSRDLANNRAIQKAIYGINNSQNKALANDNKNRAIDKALNSKQDNKLNDNINKLKDSLKDILNSLKDTLIGYGKDALKSYSNLAATMRKANLSQADKDKIQVYASTAKSSVSSNFNNLDVSKNEINDYLANLIASGKDLTAMSDEQRASFIALQKVGIDSEKAYVMAMTTSAEALKGPIDTMRNTPGVAQAMNKSLDGVTAAQAAAMGGWGKTLDQFSKSSKTYIENLGMSGVATEEAGNLIRAQAKLNNGLTDQISEAESKMLPLMRGDGLESTINNIKNQDTALLARQGVINDSYANMQMLQDSGVDLGGKVYSSEQVSKNNQINQTDGKVRSTIENLVDSLDSSFGGVFGKAANRIDEMFGETFSLDTVVTNGFKIVTLLLGAIVKNTGPVGKILAGGGILGGIYLLIKNIDTITDMFRPFIGDYSDVIADSVNSFVANMSGVVSSISGNSDNTTTMGKAIPSNAASSLSGITGSLEKSIPIILNGIGKLLEKAVPFILDLMSKVIGYIADNIDSITQFISDKVVPKIQAMLPELTKIALSLLGAFKPLLKDIAPVLGAAVGIELAKVFGIGAIKKLLIDIPRLLFGKLSSLVAKAGTALLSKFPVLLKGIIPKLLTKVLPLAIKAIPVVGWIVTALQVGAWVLKTFFPDTYKKITDFLDNIVNNIKEFFIEKIPHFFTETLPTFFTETIPQKLSEFGDWIWEKLDPIISPIRETVSSIFNSVYEFVFTKVPEFFTKTVPEFFTKTVPNFFTNTLPAKLTEIKDSITNWFSQKITDIKTSITELPDKIGTFIEELPEKIVTRMKNIGSDIKDAAVNLASDIGNWFTGGSEYAKGVYTTRPIYNATIGESGREAVLPLTNKGAMYSIMSQIPIGDKKTIVNSAVNTTPTGNLITDNAIAYARDQLGKPYSIYSDGFVCNTLVQSAFRSAGMKNFPSGTVSTHWGSSKLHKVNINDAIPGMIGFSNRSSTTGYPQHMGIITTDGKWINASGSSDSYSNGKFKAKDGSKGVVESLMNKTAKWGMVGAGFYDGMFDAATSKYISTKQLDLPDGVTLSDSEVNSQAALAKEMTPEEYSKLYLGLADGTDVIANSNKNTQLESLRELSKNAIATVVDKTDGQVKYDVSKSKSAQRISDNNSQRDEIISSMRDVIKYLRDMASFVKKPAGASAPARLPHA